MNSLSQPAALGCAELATLAMNDVLVAHRVSPGTDSLPNPYTYLCRRDRLERLALAPFDRPERKDWVLRGLLPVIITAGRVELLAIVHAGRTSAPVHREAVFVHVFSASEHESWHAGIYRRQNRPLRIGAWSAGADGWLGEPTIAAITGALAAAGQHAGSSPQ